MRKLLCLLLALAACCLLATAAAAADTPSVPTTCEACGGAEVSWTPLPSGNTWRTLAEGHYHYYLTKNDTTYRFTPNPSGDITSTNSGKKVTICLDLNGYNISTAGRALGLYTGCTLNIMDSSVNQTGYIQGSTANNNPSGGTMFLYGTLNVYSGTLKFQKDDSGYGCGAGCVANISSGGVLNLYGGKIEGSEAVISTYGLSKNGYGGAINVPNGTLNVYGGEITSGSVPESGAGPCIYIYGSSSVTLSGNGNVANICVDSSSAKVNVSGTYSGKARITYGSAVTPSAGKVVGTASNTPKITGDLFCTNGDGWLVNVSGSSLKLAAYTPSGERHYCEHCKEVVRWTAMTSSNYAKPNTTAAHYHYYLDGTLTTFKQFQLCNGAEVCLDLYGNHYTPTGRALLANGGSTLNLMDTQGGSTVHTTGGSNNERGGTVTVSGTATMNMYGGTIKFTPGTSTITKRGVVAIGGTLNMYGGKIEGGDLTDLSASTGGAVFLYTSNNVHGVLNAYGGEITSGTVNSVGPCVYASVSESTVKLAGDADVENIYFPSNNQKLTVSGDYTGNASVTFGDTVALGDEVGVSDNATITGRIACTNGEWLITPQGEKLVISMDAKVVVVTDSTETGYDTLQAAINACEDGYVKLLHPVTENVTVDKDLYIDLNGNTVTGTVTVDDGATLYGMDSQTDDYTVEDTAGYGKLTVSGNVAAQEGYLQVDENGAISFHRVTVKLTHMTLRPTAAGIYYKSSFLGDEKVAAEVKSFGVALSIQETPTADNLQSVCGYSVFTNFESGAAGNASTSTLLKGILKETNSEERNTSNLITDIYGRPYIQTADGYIFGNSVQRNLSEQLKDVDTMLSSLNGNQRNALLTMYETYQTVLEALPLPNTAEAKEMNDKTLSILMVGNSFCYYYVEELYGLLMANPDPDRGYENVEIYNLYYSGCTLTKHYDWWQAGEAKYDLYKTDVNGRKKQTSPTTGAVWTLEETLAQGRWDYLSLQGASSENNYAGDSTEANVAKMIPLVTPLLARFHELHPQAQLLWHRTWPFEVGRISGSTTYTEDLNAKYNAGMQAVCDYMCNEFDQDKPYDLKMVNSGAAWVVAREENAKLETSLIPVEGGLCARLGVRNEKTFPYYTDNANAGDGYHDGDIGGGQFLNACVWYETLTGQSVLDNPYKPTTTKGTYEVSGKYELSDEFADLLRNAAHTVLNEE